MAGQADHRHHRRIQRPSPAIVAEGLSLATSSIRCTPAEMFDMRLNSHSRLALITTPFWTIKVEGAGQAVMLDPSPAATSRVPAATSLFWIRTGRCGHHPGQFCFNGVTRGQCDALCRVHRVPIEPGHFPLADLQP